MTEEQNESTPENIILIRKISAGIIIAAIVFAGILTLFPSKAKKRPPVGSVPQVKTILATPKTINLNAQGFGTSRAAREVNIAPQVQGRVIKISENLRRGEFIKKGERLIRIDDSDYKLSLNSATANLEKSEAALARIEQEIKNIQKQLALGKDNVALAQRDFDRLEALMQQNAASQSQLDAKKRTLLSEQTKLLSYENTLAILPIQKQEMIANLKSAQNQKEKAILDLSRTVLTAPFDSCVMNVNTELGALLSSNQTIVHLSDSNKIEIPVILSASDIATLCDTENNTPAHIQLPGRSATVCIEASKSTPCIQGVVVRVEPMNPKTRMISVVVEVKGSENSPAPIQTGLFCKVKITGPTIDNAIAIPTVAVHQNNTVFLLDNNTLRFQEISIGETIGTNVIVKSGLKENDYVITSTLRTPVNGMAITSKLKSKASQNK